MATLDAPDFETTRQQLVAFGANRDPDLGTSPVEFLGEQAGAQAQIAQSQLEAVGRASADAIPSSDSSDTGLKDWSVSIGLSNGAGDYGPRGATAASGAAAQLTGDKGTAYLAGQLAQAPGGVVIKLRANVTIPAGTGTGQVDSVWDVDATDANSLGAKGNLTGGEVCTFIGTPAGSDSQFTILSPGMTVLGQDAELGPALLGRIQFKMQRPPNGGNGTDYASWATEATDANGNPVTTITLYAWVYPCYFAAGSPLVVLTAAGSGIARKPGSTIVAAVKDSINGSTTREGQRPTGTDCEVFEPYMPNARALGVRVRCIASLPKYEFDWVRGTTNLVVAVFSIAGLPAWATNAGANAVLTLNTDAPVSLKDAIDQGNEPRVQVDTIDNVTPDWAGPVIPEQARAVAYNQIAGPATEIGLKVNNPADWAVWIDGGNKVYSGGPIVDKVAAAIVAAIDERGPSRVSGLYDLAQLWADIVTISTLTTAAETTLDDDGFTRLVERCITTGGATADLTNIRIGAGGTESLDPVQAIDTNVFGPELLRAGRVLVTD